MCAFDNSYVYFFQRNPNGISSQIEILMYKHFFLIPNGSFTIVSTHIFYSSEYTKGKSLLFTIHFNMVRLFHKLNTILLSNVLCINIISISYIVNFCLLLKQINIDDQKISSFSNILIVYE